MLILWYNKRCWCSARLVVRAEEFFHPHLHFLRMGKTTKHVRKKNICSSDIKQSGGINLVTRNYIIRYGSRIYDTYIHQCWCNFG